MINHDLRDILIQELGIGSFPEEAQREVIAKLGDIILKSLTTKIFEKLPQKDRETFERISATGETDRIQEFLEMSVPNLHTLMEEEIKKTLQSYGKTKEGQK